ncbi:hypothetical protein LCGC14_0428570 [marine sediment metagenome]|uniref:Rad50/SbcC-type AAA domain-containing protein n=1 Tax=marine sediment metagenome TaxID=412755 RepID=A0A0F9T6X9_9ZZZZ
MRITGIYIKDFGNHRETIIDLKHALSIFRGPNESGKTVIRDAVQWAFTGMCRGMEKRKDEPNLIRHGAKQAEVRVNFEHDVGYEITRTVSASAQALILQKEGKVKATGIKDAQAAIYEVLQVSEALLANLFDAFELSRLASKDRKKIIQALFTSDSPDVLEKYLVDNGHSGLAKATVNGTGSTHMDLILAAYESKGIEGASAYAVDQRILAKRELRELVDPEAPEGKGMTDAEMEGALKEFRTVQASRDELAGPVLNAAKEAAEPDQIPRIKDKINALQKEIKPDGELANIADNAALRLKKAQETDAKAVAEQQTDGESPALIAHMNALSVLTVTGNEASKKTIVWLEGEIAKIEADQPTAAKPKKYEPLAPEAQQVYDAAAKTHADNKVLENQVQALKASIESEKAIMAKTAEKGWGWTPEKVQNEISKLDTQLEALRKKCSASDLITDYEKRKAEVVKKRGFLHKKIVNWDSACKVLDPKHEALAALFSSGKERFDNQFKQITKEMGLETYLADDYTFRSTGFGQADSCGWLSKSRQFRVGAALLIAICEQIGFHTVILDEGDILYDKSKTDMTNALRGVQASGLNAMLFTSGKAEAQEIDDDTHIYAVEEGQVI